MSLRDLLASLVLEIQRSGHLNEANTRSSLIDPVLDALGWNTRDHREVDREHAIGAGSKVDYALMVGGRPVVLVEAKPVGARLDQALVQTIGYGGAVVVRWVVLSNGDEYRIYDVDASGGHAEKLVATTRLSDGPEAEQVLALLGRDAVPHALEGYVAHRAVRSAVESLFGERPDPGLVRLLCRRGLDRQQVQEALRGVRVQWGADPQLAAEHNSAPDGPQLPSTRRRRTDTGAPARPALAESVYQSAALEYLARLPRGEATTADIHDHLRGSLPLGPADLQGYPDGCPVWRKRADSALARLKQRGQISQPTRGQWRLASIPVPAASKRSRRPDRATSGAAGRHPVRHGVTLADLVTAGIVAAGSTLYADYKGQRASATVSADGGVTLLLGTPETFVSPSDAAGRARGLISGDRDSYSTNGWTFWSLARHDGTLERLDSIRRRYLDDTK